MSKAKGNPMADDSNLISTAEARDLFPGFNAPGTTLAISAAPLMNFTSTELPMLFAYEQLILAAVVHDIAPKCVIEFGTGQGAGTLLLAANAGDDAEIHTVDLDPAARSDYTAKILRDDDDVGAAYKASAWRNRVKQMLVRPNEPAAGFAHLKGRVDFAYIDGDHTYDGVRTDTLIALDIIKPDATLLWHDFYDFPGYIREGRAKRGVFPWLNEMAAKGEFSLYHISGTYMVVGRRNWGRDIPCRLRRPGDRPDPFGVRIVRQGEA